MSVHDALVAWQAGEITTARAIRLTGASDLMELYAFAHDSDVALRGGLLPREARQASLASTLICRLQLEEEASADYANQRAAAM